MSKRKWHTKAIYLVVALVMALSLAAIAAPTNNVSADPGLSRWSKVATPDLNSSLDNKIRQGSDLKDFAVSSDGETIYVIGDLNGVPKLWKSTNGGASFIDKTKYLLDADDLPAGDLEELTAVAVSPDDAKFLVVAGTVAGEPVVAISEDGCAKFVSTGFEDAAAGMEVSPRCLDISKEYHGKKAIAVGVTNPAITAGKVFIAEVGGIGISWKDTSTYAGFKTAIAVTSLVFSPAYATDKNLVVITTDGSYAYLQYLKWSTAKKAWNSSGGFSSYAKIDDVVGISDLALPSDYMGGSSTTRTAFVLLTGVVGPTDSETEDQNKVRSRVYKIDNISVTDVCGPSTTDLFASLAYNGTIDEGKAMLGVLGGAWDMVNNQPTPKSCCSGL